MCWVHSGVPHVPLHSGKQVDRRALWVSGRRWRNDLLLSCRPQGGEGGRRHRRARSDEAKAAAAPEEPRIAAILDDIRNNRTQQYALEVRAWFS